MNFLANPIYIEWINNKTLLYSMGNNSQYPIINHNGKEYEKEYIYTYKYSEEEIRWFLKDLSPLHVQRVQNGCKCFAFVDLGSVHKAALAIQVLNGRHCHKQKLYVNSNNRSPKRAPDVTERPQALPISEKPPAQRFAEPLLVHSSLLKLLASPVRQKPKTSFFGVPMEMTGSFLVLLLRECFWDLGWLATTPSIGREVGLLVTSTAPQTPFFWATHIICTGTCGPCSAPWPRRRSSRPACMTWPCRTGPTVWPGTTWAITDQPGTGAGCWATRTPRQWSRSWILASQPPSRCSPCTARTVMTSGSHTSWGLRSFSDVATVSTFPLPSRFCLPCPFTLEVLGVKKATVVPRTDWIPLCLSWAHFSICHVSSLWTSEPNREASVRLKVWRGQCILSCLLSLLCTPRAWSKLPWQILQNAEAHCLIFLAFHCRIR